MIGPFLPLAIAALLSTVAADLPKAPLPPAEAPRHIKVPDGFQVTLFAGEPDLVQPISFTFDPRGRLWVAECYSYPYWIRDGKPGRDRILIFEDRDGDGKFDTRKVFWDKGSNISSLQVGFGGVWMCAAPNLIFLADRDGDDVPDGPPELLLDGWSLDAKHNVVNELQWGPDGWLYGCNGITATSRIGKPGTPDDQRTPLNCGVWRFHPTKRTFEVVAWGTTNPWGLDYDDYGQIFITNCVIAHLWHVVPGAHFQRMFGQDLNPNVYSLIDTCADHIHWAGGSWTSSRGGQGKHGEAGGGHAHVGAMVYLGDNWPDRYRNNIFMCNLHGTRINCDILERRGSGYVAHHGKDFMFVNDSWFRGLALHYGPDGGVYVSDWTDTGECHNYDKVHLSGRIYKITYGKTAPVKLDLAKLSDADLVKLQLHKNDWHVRQARRILQERAAAGKLSSESRKDLRKLLEEHGDVTRRLRALWALHVTGGLEEKLTLQLLNDTSEYLRGWAVQLVLEDRKPSEAVRTRLADMAARDSSAFVRLYLASGLQRLPVEQRWAIAEALVGHAKDADDLYLPLMIWYGIEPLVPADRSQAVNLITRARIPLIREYVARRLTAMDGLTGLMAPLSGSDHAEAHADILKGILEAVRGRRDLPMPEAWPAAFRTLEQSSKAEVREQAMTLAVLFGDPRALAALQKLVADPRADPEARQQAVETLVYKKVADLAPLLQKLVSDRAVRSQALRGLAAYHDEKTPEVILENYKSFSAEDRANAVNTLASRPAYVLKLLDAIERDQVPRQDLSPFTVRQLVGLNQPQINERLNKVWGAIRPASEDKVALLARYRKLLSPDYVKKANLPRGRAIYAQHCAACHVLFDDGGKIGPELTGSQRTNLEYVLENVLVPSAVVQREYQVTVIQTVDGRVLNGIIKQENDNAVTVQTQTEAVVVPKKEIDTRTVSAVSMMPDGLLDKLKDDEVRDLIGYMAAPKQVALPKTEGKKVNPPKPDEGE